MTANRLNPEKVFESGNFAGWAAKNSVANSGVYFKASRTDTGVDVALMVGGGGTNHGVWSDKQGKWLIYGDASNVYVDGLNMSKASGSMLGGKLVYHRVGNVVQVNLLGYVCNSTGDVATIPAEFRPASYAYFSDNANYVGPDGNVRIARTGTYWDSVQYPVWS